MFGEERKQRKRAVGYSVSEVLSLRPELVPFEIIPLKRDHRGTFYFLKHAESSSYLKIHESLLDVVKMFDGSVSVREVIDEVSNSKNLKKRNVVQLVNVLAKNGFFKNLDFSPGEGAAAFTFKIKIIDPGSKVLRTVYEGFSFLSLSISKLFFVVFCLFGIASFLYYCPEIFYATVHFIGIRASSYSISSHVLILMVMYLVAFFHEISHGVAYYFLSGEVGEMGFAFHFFLPFLYTKTLETRSMGRMEAMKVFLVGPVVNAFFTSLFTIFYLLDPFSVVWPICAYGAALGTLTTFIPFFKGDGYFILQRLTKFPNLMSHSIDHLKMVGKLLTLQISLTTYREYLARYSQTEKKVLLPFSLLLPIVIGLFMYFTVFQALTFGAVKLLFLTPKIVMGQVSSFQIYFLWGMYLYGFTLFLLGILGTFFSKIQKEEVTRLKYLPSEEEYRLEKTTV